MTRILVLYGTTDGHTFKVATALADTLRAQVADTDVVNAALSQPHASDYDAVIVAASVHAGGYQSDVHKWVQENATALDQRPTAFVSVCLGVLQKDPNGQAHVAETVQQFVDTTKWKPSMRKLVAGALLYRNYNWIKRWIMKRIVAKTGGDTDTSRNYEYTDWNDLRAFAAKFGSVVRTAAGHKRAVAERPREQVA
jgi:menaquinone-dependent protoporphyrinogen oxidase